MTIMTLKFTMEKLDKKQRPLIKKGNSCIGNRGIQKKMILTINQELIMTL